MAAVLVLLGAAMLVAGVAVLCWPLGLSVAGLLLILAGFDLRRSPVTTS